MVAKLQKKNDRKNKYINNLPFLSLLIYSCGGIIS